MSNLKKLQTYKEYVESTLFKEKLVSMETFLSDDYFLGASTNQGDAIYPVWKKALLEIDADKTKYLVVLTGATSIGKTFVADIDICRIMYYHLNLKDPWGYYNLAQSDKMALSFFNLNLTLGASVGFRQLQALLAKSQWFRDRASSISKVKEGEVLNFSLFEYALSSPKAKGHGIVGKHIICGMMDEIDNPTISMGEKQQIQDTYDATLTRFKNRFATDGYSLGKMFIVSSKQDEMSFVDTFIAKEKSNKSVLVYDVPTWEAKPAYNFCGEKFLVAVGNAFKLSKMLAFSEGTPEEYKKTEFEKFRIDNLQNGYEILDVPIEYVEDFKRNITLALRDIAGRTIAGTRKSKLIADEHFITDCFEESKLNPITQETIEIGLNDNIELIWFLDLSKIRMDKSVKRSIGLDISFSGDAMSIAMSGIKDWREGIIQKPDGTFEKEMFPVVETDFIMRIKARDGDRIPLHKMRKFVLDLKAAGFNIWKFNADLLLASEDTLQLLNRANIAAGYFSVDKTLQPYTDFRNLIYEKRWICFTHKIVKIELKNLEIIDNKVDHPKEVQEQEWNEDKTDFKIVVIPGSKDCSDAVCNSVINSILDAEKPIDVVMMSKMLKQSKIQTEKTPRDDVGIKFHDPSGQEIVGVRSPGGDIERINDIFKRLRGLST